MKAPVELIRKEVRRKFALSSRATHWVADMYFHPADLGDHAREHLGRNGGQPSESAAKALSFLHSQPVDSLYLWAQMEAPDAGCYEWTDSDKMALLEMHSPAEHEKELAALITAGDEWWNREGKYEEAAEEQGTYKDYLYACQLAQQFSEPEPHISEFVRL